jgi:glycosyltransferase involved in cell wall biosynthesis
MNIFLLTETSSGCYKWRAAIPAEYLRRRGHQVQIFDMKGASRYEAPDVVVLYRAHFHEGIKIIEWCKRNRIRVVFDTDDALDLVPPENLNYKLVRPRLGLYEALLGAADVVTTTTPALAEHLRQSNPNVVVVPNAVDPEEWTAALKTSRPKTGPARVGWTGSPTHFADLAVALDAVRELQKKYDFLLVLQGLCKESSLDELYTVLQAIHPKSFFETPFGQAIKHFMAKLSGIRYEFHPNVPIEEHARKVCDLSLDVGIAPLVDNPFNRHKSCIKYYEYAMSGAVTVASHTVPYSEEVPITAKNNREAWKHKLEMVLSGDRAAMWREQRDWVLQHRNIETIVEQWERVLGNGTEPARPSVAQPEEVVPV